MPWKSTWTLADLAEEFNNRPNLDGVELFEREKNGVVSQLYPDDLVNDVVEPDEVLVARISPKEPHRRRRGRACPSNHGRHTAGPRSTYWN